MPLNLKQIHFKFRMLKSSKIILWSLSKLPIVGIIVRIVTICIEVVDLRISAMIPSSATIFKSFLGFVALVIILSSLEHNLFWYEKAQTTTCMGSRGTKLIFCILQRFNYCHFTFAPITNINSSHKHGH